MLFQSNSPVLRAALYRVLAHLPGVRLLGTTADRIGRRGIAIAASVGDGVRGELLLDPATSDVLQVQFVQVAPSHLRYGPDFQVGTVTAWQLMGRGRKRMGRLDTASQALARELADAGYVAQPPASADEADPVMAALSPAEPAPLDREIIEMGSWDGLTPREIGTVLGLSANVVRVRAHRARARLRSALASSVPQLAYSESNRSA